MQTKPYRRRGRPSVQIAVTLLALLIASAPLSVPAARAWAYKLKTTDLNYEKQYGRWDIIELPKEFRMNTVHASMLPSGKILMIAGSGNNRQSFDKYHNENIISVLKTGIFDPETNKIKLVSTPADFFCGGHALLQSGNVLIAGGTSGYEVLKQNVKNPAGAMTLHNENPNGQPKTFPKGTKFVSPSGKVYVSVQAVTLNPAMKMGTEIMHSSAKVFVEAVGQDSSYLGAANLHYTIQGLTGEDTHNIYGQGGAMTRDKQDYRGDNQSYEFNPYTEQYEKVGSLNESRWYPSLPVLSNGHVLAVSGIDNVGVITTSTEQYNPRTKSWTKGVNRPLPTYPALFRTANPDVLFFSGSNAGYGPANIGRQPGYWNYKTNSFDSVSGLSHPDMVEQSGSVMLPPNPGTNDGSQGSRIMLFGGGGVGESKLVTNRTAIIDIAAPNAHYIDGPTLPVPVRYINVTVTPWDEVIAAGGSSDYRARNNSYSYQTLSFNPATSEFTKLADEQVGRSYHSGSLLLPDGRILVFGNDPLFSDKADTIPSIFEQRLEIFTPPQLYRSNRPTLIGKGNQDVHRGQDLVFASTDPTAIKTARLIPPSSTTHVTNIEQRSVGVVEKVVDGQVHITLPTDESILPDGWYMVFVTNSSGTPNKSIRVHVVS